MVIYIYEPYLYFHLDETKPYLLVTSQKDLMKAGLDVMELTNIQLPGIQALAGLDVHVEKQHIFFSDSALKKIFRVNVDGSNLTEVLCDYQSTVCRSCQQMVQVILNFSQMYSIS
jgi:hypothetical protein